MVVYYPLEYALMEITDSLAADIKNAPKWFHEASWNHLGAFLISAASESVISIKAYSKG